MLRFTLLAPDHEEPLRHVSLRCYLVALAGQGGMSPATDPAALIAYSEAGLRIDAELDASAIRLRAVLDEFAATCTEYHTGIDGSLADGLRNLARRNREHNLWVRQVAEEFQRADASGTPEPVAFVTPQPSPVPEPVGTPIVPPAKTDTGPTLSLPV